MGKQIIKNSRKECLQICFIIRDQLMPDSLPSSLMHSLHVGRYIARIDETLAQPEAHLD